MGEFAIAEPHPQGGRLQRGRQGDATEQREIAFAELATGPDWLVQRRVEMGTWTDKGTAQPKELLRIRQHAMGERRREGIVDPRADGGDAGRMAHLYPECKSALMPRPLRAWYGGGLCTVHWDGISFGTHRLSRSGGAAPKRRPPDAG